MAGTPYTVASHRRLLTVNFRKYDVRATSTDEVNALMKVTIRLHRTFYVRR